MLPILGVFGVRALFEDLRAFCHAGQHPVFDLADAACHGAELRHRIFQAIADHRVFVFVGLCRKEIIDFRERRAAIEIIRVDDGKRTVYHALAAGQRMAGAPRLCASLRSLYALRQAVKILIDVGHMEILLHAVADAFAELRFHLALDDEHHVAETCAPCVKQGKVDDDMSFRIDRLDLLEAAEAAAHARGQYDKRYFLHTRLL